MDKLLSFIMMVVRYFFITMERQVIIFLMLDVGLVAYVGNGYVMVFGYVFFA